MIIKSMKVLSIIAVSLFFASLLPSSLSINASIKTQSVSTDNLLENTVNVTIHASSYSLRLIQDGKVELQMDDFGYLLQPGYPKIPSKIFTIGLPANSRIESIQLVDIISEKLDGSYQLTLVNDSYQLGKKYEPNREIKSIQLPSSYPKSIYSILGSSSYQGFEYINIRFTPFTYYEKNQSLTYHKKITFQLKYTILQEQNLIENNTGQAVIPHIFDNREEMQDTNISSPSFSQVSYEYLFITPDYLVESIQFLRYWREIKGHSTKIVTTSWIYEFYNGNDEAEKIKNFLIEKYEEWGIQYVLFIGSSSLIPMRNCYPDANNHAYSGRIPTDYYYADLTGEWDKDGDGYYGEKNDDDPDFLADVHIGRIPFDVPWTVEHICQKIIEFEQTDENWKKQALLIGALLTLQNEDHSGYAKTDGAYLMERLSAHVLSPASFESTTLYERNGLSPSIFSSDYALTRNNVINEYEKGYGFVNWNGHGSSTATYRLYWEEDDGDGVPEHSEIASPFFIQTGELDKLNDDKPAIVFSCSCENAHPEYKNLGAELLKHGAVSFIGASRSAWGTVGWKKVEDGGCTSIDYLFSEYLIGEKDTVGSALYRAKYDYFSQYAWWDWKSYQNLYVFNLYGDPATSYEAITHFTPPTTPIITQDQSEGIILSNITLSTFSSDIDQHQLFYQWDYGDGTYSDWIGPFEEGKDVNMNLQWNEQGLYTVSVRVKDMAGMESDWSDPIQVKITSPDIQIKRMSSGIGSFRVVLLNSGNAEAKNVSWTIQLNKGLHLNSKNAGVIESILPNERAVIRNPFLFGFGLPAVIIEIESEKLEKQTYSTTALLLGPVIII